MKPKLSPAPPGFTWQLKQTRGQRGQVKGSYYQILLKQGPSTIIDQRFFISKDEESTTEMVIMANEEKIRKLLT